MKRALHLFIFCLPLLFILAFGCESSSSGIDGDATPTDGDSIDGDDDSEVDDSTGMPTPELSLSILSGNYQSGFYGDDLAPIEVQALDREGAPAKDIDLSILLQTGIGLSTADNVVVPSGDIKTDESGMALIPVSLGNKSGIAQIQIADKQHKAVPINAYSFAYHPKDEYHQPLCILEINDFHMRMLPKKFGSHSLGGLARIASVFKEIRKNNDAKGIATLIINTGDDFENTLFHNVPGAISTLYKIYDAIGVDITQVGNHDYHFGIPMLDENIAEAQKGFKGTLQGHPMIFSWGNVDPSTLFEDYKHYADRFEVDFNNKDNSARFNQTVTLDLGGMKVGVLGVTTDAAIYTQVAGNPFLYQIIGAPRDYTEGLTFFNPDPRESDYIGKAIDDLAGDGADAILVASHAGLGYGDRVNIPPGKDQFIAMFGQGIESSRGVDLVISGHSHVPLYHTIKVDNFAGGQTHIIQAKEAGEYIGMVVAEVDTDADEMTITDGRLLQVDATIKEDTDVAEKVDALKQVILEEYGDIFNKVIGKIGITLSSQERAQSGLGQIIADSFYWKLKGTEHECDATMAVPSMYRADIDKYEITEERAYDMMPLHNLDAEGLNDEPLIYVELTPGLFDMAIFNMEPTKKQGMTVVEYILETVFSLEAIDPIYPGVDKEFNFEVLQFSGLSYSIDYSAPVFQRVVPGSIKINGGEIDPSKTYRLAMSHSIGVNLAYILNFLVTATDPETGDTYDPIITHDDTELPYVDSKIKCWKALRDYIEATFENRTDYIPENAIVTGDRFRTVQPDLSLNPTDIVFDKESVAPGESVGIEITLHNFGETPVKSAEVGVYYESTPWDLTDDDDGRLQLEGFPESYEGSLIQIDSFTVALDKYPAETSIELDWNVPEDLPPYAYPVVVRIRKVTTDVINPNTGEPYAEAITGNNIGPEQQRPLMIIR